LRGLVMLDLAALICAVLLMVYLVVAMLYPEKF
jgi:K+-transporting ATPase KdpF subunit